MFELFWPPAPRGGQKQGYSQKQGFSLHVHCTANRLITHNPCKQPIHPESIRSYARKGVPAGEVLHCCWKLCNQKAEVQCTSPKLFELSKNSSIPPYQALLSLQEAQGSVTKNYIHWDFSHIKMLKHCGKNPCIGRKISKHRFGLFLGWILSPKVKNYRKI